MSSVSTARTRPKDYLSKKIPASKKYQNVKCKTDTGQSMSKYMNKIEEIRANYRFRKDEIFKRMKVTTFVQLALQVYDINTSQPFDDEDGPPSTAGYTDDVTLMEAGDGGSPVPSLALTAGDYGYQDNDDVNSVRSTLLSVAHGVGELDLNGPAAAPRNDFVNDECPYLLLDVRDDDAYDQCHIISAKNFPKARLSRAQNFETKEMMQYRNIPGKIIIIYDEDESIAPKVATTLVQRGYDNLFMLSGGMKLTYKLIKEGFITGTPPPTVTVGEKPCKKPQRAYQSNFTPEDINKIGIYLDSALEDRSIGNSSRLSQASTARSRNAFSTNRSAGSGRMSTLSEKAPFK